MNLKVEQMADKNMYRLIVETDASEIERGLEKAYQKNKSKISIPGFRKGKAPRSIIEKLYGKGVFLNDAAEEIVPELYEEAAKESGLDIISRPDLKVTQLELDKPMIFTAEVAVKPEIKLGDYKSVEVTKRDTSVSDKEVDEEIEKARKKNARNEEVTDRPVKDGDIVDIDFEGSVDGVAFEGGKGTDYPLTIGSHTFIDNFEEQLIGMNLGEEKEIEVKFPEDYHAESLKGKDAVFKVKIKKIQEKILPAADDEFAQDVSEFDTFDEYKKSVKENIKKMKEAQAKNSKEREAIDKVIEGSEMEIPEPAILDQARKMVDSFANNIARQGMDFKEYLKRAGLTVEKLIDSYKADAKKRLEQRYVLEAVVKEAKIDVSDDEFKKEIENYAKGYNLEAKDFENILDESGKELIKQDAAIRKAIDMIVENAKEVKKEETGSDKEPKKEEKKKTTRKTSKKTDESKKESKDDK